MTSVLCFRKSNRACNQLNCGADSMETTHQFSKEIIKKINEDHNIKFGSHLRIHKDKKNISYKENETLSERYVKFDRIYLILPIHHSLSSGKKNCFRILTKEDSGDYHSIIFSCLSQQDRNNQIQKLLDNIVDIGSLYITEETCLRIKVQEARNLSIKYRYYCELKLDDILYARTSIKKMTDILLWCEEFDFKGLPNIKIISLTLWKMSPSPKDKHIPQIVCQVNISTTSLDRNTPCEKWYSPSPVIKLHQTSSNQFCINGLGDSTTSSVTTGVISNNLSHPLTFSAACSLDNPPDKHQEQNQNLVVRDTAPLLRVLCCYFPLRILPVHRYDRLIHFMFHHIDGVGYQFLRQIELSVTARFREQLIRPVVRLAILCDNNKGVCNQLLAQLVCNEASSSDINLILRGNSICAKAIECFLKMECQQYLENLLNGTIKEILKHYSDIEIDTGNLMKMKVSVSANALKKRHKRLEHIVSSVLEEIFNSIDKVPRSVRSLFFEIRNMLMPKSYVDEEILNTIISACFFLRLVCPAILTPYLFNLLPEYSNNKEVHRAFTLVAKCVQNVANFASIEEMKEVYMHEMVVFCRRYYKGMSQFLSRLSQNPDAEAGTSLSVLRTPSMDIVSTPTSSVSQTNTESSKTLVGFPGDTSYHRDYVAYEAAKLCYHLDHLLNNIRGDAVKSALENDLLNIVESIKKDEEQIVYDIDTIDKIKNNLKQQIYSNHKQLEMSTKSSGYFSTINENMGYLDSLLRAQELNESSMTDILKLEKSKVVLYRKKMDQLSFLSDEYQSVQVPETMLDEKNLYDTAKILSCRHLFEQYINYAEEIIESCFDTNFLRNSHDKLEKVVKVNSDIQIHIMKQINETVEQ